ncbi:MAG: hybrid sensor histidine kinase/response regulator [Polyangiaceae bacterium]
MSEATGADARQAEQVVQKEPGESVSDVPEEVIQAELEELLFANGVRMVLTSMGACLVMGGATFAAFRHVEALVWVGIVWLVGASRIPIITARNRWKLSAQQGEAPPFRQYFLWQAAAFGLAWGSSAALLQFDEPWVIYVAVLLVGATVNGALLALGPYPRALSAFVAALTLPWFARILWEGPTALRLQAVTALLYIVALAGFIRRYHEMLRHSVAIRFQNQQLLERVKVEKRIAEEAGAAKTQFIAAASHDLRQPLHAIRLFLGALKSGPDEAQRARIVGQLEEATNSLAGLLDSLLDLSRADAGVIRARPASLDLQRLLHTMDVEWRAVAEQKGLRFRVKQRALWVRSDPELLTTILRNLISNAIRYTERGGILVGCRVDGQFVRVGVWDTGSGIPESEREAIFREFHQLGNPERNPERGLGLGLAIVQRFAGLLHHDLEVESVPGRGSYFGLKLPRARAERTPELATPKAQVQLHGLRVLVVDDDVHARQAMDALLSSHGAQVYVAADAEQALVLAEQPLDWVVCDLRLPGEIDGIDLVEKLRSVRDPDGESTEHLEALIVTGDTAPAVLLDAYRRGLPIIHKPIQVDRLLSRLAQTARNPPDPGQKEDEAAQGGGSGIDPAHG